MIYNESNKGQKAVNATAFFLMSWRGAHSTYSTSGSAQSHVMKTMKVLNWILALCGLWEFGDIALPFIIGFDHVRGFVWNHIVVGLILMFAGARRALTGNVRTARTMDLVAALSGVWLILTTFLLRDRAATAGWWNDLIVGVIALLLGVWSALVLPRAAD